MQYFNCKYYIDFSIKYTYTLLNILSNRRRLLYHFVAADKTKPFRLKFEWLFY